MKLIRSHTASRPRAGYGYHWPLCSQTAHIQVRSKRNHVQISIHCGHRCIKVYMIFDCDISCGKYLVLKSCRHPRSRSAFPSYLETGNNSKISDTPRVFYWIASHQTSQAHATGTNLICLSGTVETTQDAVAKCLIKVASSQ
jgi:hypothetical protein